MQVEFVRNLHNNYGRIRLQEKPEEERYQYCILNRGGIRGLLACDLRYLDGEAYLYYDITSRQNLSQLLDGRSINRDFVTDFLWSMKQIQLELSRFLLDERNILWHPGNVFREMEDNAFSFLYVPYLKEDNGFDKLLDFFVEHIDYEDTGLVEYIYTVYERFEKHGESYLQEKIFEDMEILDRNEKTEEVSEKQETPVPAAEEGSGKSIRLMTGRTETCEITTDPLAGRSSLPESVFIPEGFGQNECADAVPRRKGLLSLMEGRGRKNKESKVPERYTGPALPENGQKVAEPVFYEEEYGRTVYIEESGIEDKSVGLYTADGKLLAKLDRPTMTLGKKRGEVTLCLDDISVSRMHARILKEDDAVYIEDLNSTNGTFKNGLRMQPYEKKKLEIGDEIKCGKVVLEFR